MTTFTRIPPARASNCQDPRVSVREAQMYYLMGFKTKGGVGGLG